MVDLLSMKAYPQSTIPDKPALSLPFYVMCKLSGQHAHNGFTIVS